MTEAPDTAARPWTAADRRALLLLLALVAVGLPFLTHGWYDRTNDGSVYLSTARALARGEGYSYLGEPFRIRPPGFSALLVPFVGGAEIDFRGVNLLVGAFGAAGAVLLFVYARARLGAALALATALFVWLLPGYQRVCNQVMSDVPGVTLLLACLLLERWASRRTSLLREVTLGLAIGLSCWLRSATIFLLPAIWAGRLLQRRPSSVRDATVRLVPFALTAVVTFAPWEVRNAAVAPEGPVDQSYQYSLSTMMLHENPRDPESARKGPARLLSYLPLRGAECLRSHGVVGLAWVPEEPGPGFSVLGALVLAVVVLGLVRRREPAELYVVAMLLFLMTFPAAFLRRYALPALVLAAPVAVEALRDLLRRVAPPRVAGAATLAVVVAGVLLTARPRQGWDRVEVEHRNLALLRERLERRLRPEDAIAAPTGFHLTLLLDRPVHSFRFAYLDHGAAGGVDFVSQKYGVDTFVLVDGEWPSFEVQEVLLGRGLQPDPFRAEGQLVQVFRVE